MIELAFLILLALLPAGASIFWRARRRPSATPAELFLSDALPDPVVVVDAQQRIVTLNKPAERLLELRTDQLAGQRLPEAIADPSLRKLFEDIRTRRAEQFRITQAGQVRTFQPMVVPTNAGRTLYLLRDLSTLAGAVQMKTDFVANASHELRTPISAIKVAFETLRDVYQDDPRQTERCITIIEGHLHRLEEMLRDLLDLSRVESAELQPQLVEIESKDLLAQLRSMWMNVAQARQINLDLPDGVSISFRSDRRLIDLVLKNLVENALKFTAPGGTVTVAIEKRADANEIELRVTDTGCGIPSEHVERVFERFYQVDSARSSTAGRGTGLGLAIVKHAVLALGGTVRLTSQIGKGTTAICTLPQ